MTANLHMNVYAGDNAVAVEKAKDSDDTYFLELSECHPTPSGYTQRNTVCAFMTRAQLEELGALIQTALIMEELSERCSAVEMTEA